MNQLSQIDSRQSGFTILEIMIATAILVVGLLGLLALFPVAMDSGRRTIEETNSILIAGSVEQAIRSGLRDRKGQSPDGKWTFFCFSHDGVEDPLPSRIASARPGSDYYVLLPSPDPDRNIALQRGEAWGRGKTFLFPETDGTSWEVDDQFGLRDRSDLESGFIPNGGGNPERADDDSDDMTVQVQDPSSRTVIDEYESYDVRRVYRLSNAFFDEERAEEEDLVDTDPISQYSFAFAIRPALQDGSLDRSFPDDSTFVPSGDLYEVEILVFRAFRTGENEETRISNEPIHRSQILVHR